MSGWMSGISDMVSSVTNAMASSLGLSDLETVEPEVKDESAEATGLADKSLANDRQDFFSQVKGMLGKDVMSLLSVPVYFMEPFSTLQKMAEIMEYPDLLDAAAAAPDEATRLAYVAAFAVSMYPSCERTCKPFNPILGETFEYYDDDHGITFLAEQVSHHPPISAAHAEADQWTYHIVSAPRTKFLGNSVEIFPLGRTRITMKASGDTYFIVPPTTRANNIIVGWPWIDSYGTMTVGASSGYRCELEFVQCGWTGAGRWEVKGFVVDPSGKKVLKLWGHWNKELFLAPCDEGGAVEAGAEKRIWQASEKPAGDKYAFTHFAHKLNSAKGLAALLPSDGRRRPDRYLLEKGETSAAQAEKGRLENQQRREKAEREKRQDKWTPRWFNMVTEGFNTFPGEPSPEEFPTWEWKGRAFRGTGPAGDADEAQEGKGFVPWCYPELEGAAEPAQEAEKE
ncbi:unnamed protein product [Pedinophyceae sp. YPF-701]|nr:unnamed protein product [Pedinophyceae sp. YPF-701]